MLKIAINEILSFEASALLGISRQTVTVLTLARTLAGRGLTNSCIVYPELVWATSGTQTNAG